MAYLNDDIVFLRALEPEDLEVLYKWENDVSLWENGSTLNPYSRFMLKEYITRSLDENVLEAHQLRLMICLSDGGKAVGTADLFEIDSFNGRAAIGLLVTKEYRNLGIAKKVLDLIVEYAANVLLLNQLYAQVACNNDACIALFEESDFTKYGVLKEWLRCKDGYLDVAMFQKIL
ncbi:MAG: GNAT family protein [Bacteroidales bacterium]